MWKVELSSGQSMPIFGLGTWQVTGSDAVYQVLDAALGAGYRLIDTAIAYKNEAEIGLALKQLLPKYNLRREDVFITSKLVPLMEGAGTTRDACLQSLKDLQLDYLDLFLIHWPAPVFFGDSLKDPCNSDIRKQTWRDLEALYKEGKFKSIGVSNYMAYHLEEMFKYCEVRPAVNQCEYHPHLQQDEAREMCEEHGIHFQAYSSLGSYKAATKLLEKPVVKTIAEKHNKTPAQVVLRWALQKGVGVIPRSTNPDRVRSNIDVFDFKLSDDDIAALTSLQNGERYCLNPNDVL